MLSIERGGGETFDLEMARHLQNLDCSVSFLSGYPLFSGAKISDAQSQSQSPNHYIRSPYYGWFPWDKVKGGWRLRLFDFWFFEQFSARWAKRQKHQFDVVHVCELPTFVHLWKRWKMAVPVVMRLTAGNFYDTMGAIPKADGVIASGMTIPQLQQGLRPDVVDVPNAVDSSFFFPHKSSFRSVYGLSENDWVLLYVARFQAFKNHAFLLNVFRRVLAAKSNARLVLVGNGPLLERTKMQARDLGVAHRISFLGEVPYGQLPAVYAGADVKVITSTFESFCFAALEAMSSELPVVTTDCGWVPRLIENQGGWIVPQDQPEAFFKALMALAEEPAAAKKMGQWNRRRVMSDFQWAASAVKLVDLYRSLTVKRS